MNDYLMKLARNEEEKRLLARLHELIRKALTGAPGHSDFMDLRQQELAMAVAASETAVAWQLDGGYVEAERKRLLVYPEWEDKHDAGIAYINTGFKEFGPQSLGHRDYLGAVLNLGVKREKLGDIAVYKTGAFLIVDTGLADYICQQLTRVGHSNVRAEIIPQQDFFYEPPELTIVRASLASLRLDAAVAAAYNLPRSEADDCIESGQVKLNQRDVYKGSIPVKAGDLISVRGRGRFRLEEIEGVSRKGRYRVLIARW